MIEIAVADTGAGHSVRRFVPHLRAILAGREIPFTGRWRDRVRVGDCQATRGDARGYDQRGKHTGQRLQVSVNVAYPFVAESYRLRSTM